MIEAIKEIGRIRLESEAEGGKILETLLEDPPKSKKDKGLHIVILNYDTFDRKVELDFEEIKGDETSRKYLWMGNLPSNADQIYSTFQDYLLSEGEEVQSDRHHHGLISALFASYLVRRIFLEKKEEDYMELLVYFVVLHHHGDLRALELDVVSANKLKEEKFLSVEEPWRSRLNVLLHQIEDIRKNLSSIELEYRELIDGLEIRDFLDTWKDTFSKIDKLSYHLLESEEEEVRIRLFTITLLLYSLLIDADKRDAADVIRTERKDIPGDLVDRYRISSPEINATTTSGIDGLRNEIYTKATKKISEVSLDNHIFTLTAPTGTGKTLTSFSCAFVSSTYKQW